jgi:hypothetical protein
MFSGAQFQYQGEIADFGISIQSRWLCDATLEGSFTLGYFRYTRSKNGSKKPLEARHFFKNTISSVMVIVNLKQVSYPINVVSH